MPLVAIVGRPNVGKSTLFNRMTDARRAIVEDQPGVTRDRLYGQAEWNGRRFDVVDTGGYVPRSSEVYEKAVREQAEIAIDEADLLLLVVDATTGITSVDEEVATLLKKGERPALVVANKADNQELRWDASAFYSLGLGQVHAISSTNGTGTGDLMDAVVENLPPAQEGEEEEKKRTHIAVIGRPNVGKSSLVNAILGHERAIVAEESGTTRDAVHSVVRFEGQDLILIDTAGLRKRARVKENVEFYSTLRTERAIQEGDVAILVIDAVRGLENQDIHVLKEAEEAKLGLLIAVNKWDLVEDKDSTTAKRYEAFFRETLQTMRYVPMRFISALHRQRIYQVLDDALEVAERRRQRIPTSKLNSLVEEAVKGHPPASYRGNHVKINYAAQVGVEPPVFAFFCNYPQGVHASYRRYLENKIRAAFDFAGVPLTLVFRSKHRE